LPAVAIINYGAGNLRSAKRGLERAGAEALITDKPDDLTNADAIVLPGVGAFSPAMKNITPLIPTLKQSIKDGKPLLGICLGLQLLFTKSSEGGTIAGLNFISGSIIKLSNSVKTPQIGWNTVKIVQPHPLLEGVQDNSYFYFVHSYVPKPSKQDTVVATTEYGVAFPSIVAKGNVFATQFHPEKSSKTGAIILKNFVESVKR